MNVMYCTVQHSINVGDCNIPQCLAQSGFAISMCNVFNINIIVLTPCRTCVCTPKILLTQRSMYDVLSTCTTHGEEQAKKLEAYAMDNEDTLVMVDPQAEEEPSSNEEAEEGAEEEKKTSDELVEPVDLHDDHAIALLDRSQEFSAPYCSPSPDQEEGPEDKHVVAEPPETPEPKQGTATLETSKPGQQPSDKALETPEPEQKHIPTEVEALETLEPKQKRVKTEPPETMEPKQKPVKTEPLKTMEPTQKHVKSLETMEPEQKHVKAEPQKTLEPRKNLGSEFRRAQTPIEDTSDPERMPAQTKRQKTSRPKKGQPSKAKPRTTTNPPERMPEPDDAPDPESSADETEKQKPSLKAGTAQC